MKLWLASLYRANMIPETLSIHATLICPTASTTRVGYAAVVDVLEMLLGGVVKVCAGAEVTYRPKASVQIEPTRQNRPKQLNRLDIIPFWQAGVPQLRSSVRSCTGLPDRTQNEVREESGHLLREAAFFTGGPLNYFTYETLNLPCRGSDCLKETGGVRAKVG